MFWGRRSKPVVAAVTVSNSKGLHARAAGELAKAGDGLEAEFTVAKASTLGSAVDGKSILDLMMLAAAKGTVLEVEASGKDARKLLRRVVKLFESGFDEGA